MHTDRFLSCAHVLFEYLIDLASPTPDQADLPDMDQSVGDLIVREEVEFYTLIMI